MELSVLFFTNFYDADLRSPEELLSRYRTTVEWCTALRCHGAGKVYSVHRFHTDCVLEMNQVQYHFVADEYPGKLKMWHTPKKALARITSLQPDVVHLNGMPVGLRWMQKHLHPRFVLLWQHHGGSPPPFPSRYMYRRNFSAVDGFFFTAAEQAKEWNDLGLLKSGARAFEIVEASTNFKPSPPTVRDDHLTRRRPTYLWVGRLNSTKDPLTVLRGFRLLVRQIPDARLTMAYSDAPLEGAVRSLIHDQQLEGHVHLVGRQSHVDIESLMTQNDYFVSGSHREGSGFSLIESLACGLYPIVTSIPSFKAITGNGTVGKLWAAGNPDTFFQAALSAASEHQPRNVVRSFFDSNLSYSVLARKAMAAYSVLLKE